MVNSSGVFWNIRRGQMEQQKQDSTGGKEECQLCRVTYSIFSTIPLMPPAMALNVETGEFFPQDTLRSYSTGHDMAESLGYAWACNCRERAPNRYDERFALTDAGGNALANTFYTVRLPSGELQHGVTDSSGKTARYKTDGAQQLALYLGHRKT
jgi:hypothetical protein